MHANIKLNIIFKEILTFSSNIYKNVLSSILFLLFYFIIHNVAYPINHWIMIDLAAIVTTTYFSLISTFYVYSSLKDSFKKNLIPFKSLFSCYIFILHFSRLYNEGRYYVSSFVRCTLLPCMKMTLAAGGLQSTYSFTSLLRDSMQASLCFLRSRSSLLQLFCEQWPRESYTYSHTHAYVHAYTHLYTFLYKCIYKNG